MRVLFQMLGCDPSYLYCLQGRDISALIGIYVKGSRLN